MVLFPTAQAFSDEAARLFAAAPLSARTSVRYRVDGGAARLTLRATDNTRVRAPPLPLSPIALRSGKPAC